jgi:hypothetical protein
MDLEELVAVAMVARPAQPLEWLEVHLVLAVVVVQQPELHEMAEPVMPGLSL